MIGANEDDQHYTGFNFGRDAAEPQFVDLRNVIEGDESPDGEGRLKLARGIEVGHVFQLRTKYSEAMNATVLDNNGKAKVMEMGCYGIGITRIVAAAIEQNNDERGIIWTDAMAPFAVVIVPMNYKNPTACAKRPISFMPTCSPPAPTCCSTTATSAPACCSTIPSCSAFRTASSSATAP